MEDLKKISEKYKNEIIKTRRHLHEHPEVSAKEYNTSSYIKSELAKRNIPFVDCGLETGILATIEGGKGKGKTILLRGDIDALSVHEETGLEYKSRNEGVMHACGHDCHISMLLYAAIMLNEVKDKIKGTIKLAFQPAEEIARGADSMIKMGAMNGVDAVFAIHIWSQVPSGRVACNPGPMMANASWFTIKIQGKGGHGAEPQNCVDAVTCACAIVNSLQTVISREFSPLKPVVCTVGRVDVGTRFNVIADNGTIEGTTRCFDMDVYEELPRKMERMITNIASAYRCKAEFKLDNLTKPVINNKDMVKIVEKSAVEATGRKDCMIEWPPTTGGEDFSSFIDAAPNKMGALAFLGCGSKEKDTFHPHHSPKFKIDEDVLLSGALLYGNVALNYLS